MATTPQTEQVSSELERHLGYTRDADFNIVYDGTIKVIWHRSQFLSEVVSTFLAQKIKHLGFGFLGHAVEDGKIVLIYH